MVAMVKKQEEDEKRKRRNGGIKREDRRGRVQQEEELRVPCETPQMSYSSCMTASLIVPLSYYKVWTANPIHFWSISGRLWSVSRVLGVGSLARPVH